MRRAQFLRSFLPLLSVPSAGGGVVGVIEFSLCGLVGVGLELFHG